jgi:hypothetical protein
MLKDCVAVPVEVVSADTDVGATVKVAIPAPAVAVRVRVPDTASTSIATELSNPNGFCGGSLC